jgi:hypothetical protein
MKVSLHLCGPGWKHLQGLTVHAECHDASAPRLTKMPNYFMH